MSVASNHLELNDPGNSFSATFRKALKGFEIGSLAYSEVQSELKRLLAGVPHRELRELLRRSESIEPLPEYAYREIRRFFDDTVERDVAPQTELGDVREQAEELDPAALSAELQKSREALESERIRVREAEQALSERIVAEEAVRSRLGITLRELDRHQAELRAARNSIASRETVIAQVRQSLDERDAQLAEIRREHGELAAALDSHFVSGEQLSAELQALRAEAAAAAAELAAFRDAADKERRKRQEIERALTESNSLNSASRASLGSKDQALAEMRETLDERDAQLAAMRREHAELAAGSDSRSASGERLIAELQALRAQAAAAAAELAASRDAADKERRKRQEIEIALTESSSLNTASRESLASKAQALAEMRQTLDERDAQLTASRDAADKERRKRQEIERALTESNSLNSAARASLASKDQALAETRRTLDESDEQLAAIRREHAELAAAFDSRSASGEQLIAELQALRAEAAAAAPGLVTSRDAADKERRKRQEIERALTESNSLNSAARASLASKDEALTEMGQMLDERDAQLAALQRELQAALHASEEKLQTAQRRAVGANADLDSSRAQVANLQARLRDDNALIEKLGASVRSEAERATQWQAAAQQRKSETTVTSPRMEVMRQVEVLPRARAAKVSAAPAKFLSAVRGWRRNILMAPRPIWIGVAVVVLGTVIWFAAHRPSSSAAMVQPAITAPAIESAEPETASTENVAAIEAPPHAAATPAAERPLTAGEKLNTNFRRCRAGGIDACYDAIRYRPSDPSLLSALGDALLRANRSADALRAYQRVAILVPDMPGIVAKISTLEAKLSSKQAAGGGSRHATDAMRNSNVPQTQSH
jgi:chromosome segregation ATPase